MNASPETRTSVQAVVEGLGYDFDHFEIEDFQRHIATRRGRPLNVHYVPLSPELFGLWYPTEDVDYIAVNSNLLPLHQIHTLLHEFAHMFLGHRGMKLSELLGDEIARSAAISSAGAPIRSRFTCQRIEGSESSNHWMTERCSLGLAHWSPQKASQPTWAGTVTNR